MHMIQLSLYITLGLIIWISTTRTKPNAAVKSQLLMYRDGIVKKENFVYFSVEEEGDLRLNLTSIDGDADLYISENAKLPTYEPGKYDLQAATCGDDIIEIPKSFKRPITIGIYTNSMQEFTAFLLQIERVTYMEETSYSDFLEPPPPKVEQKNKRNGEDSKSNKPSNKIKAANKLDFKTLIFGILEALASAL